MGRCAVLVVGSIVAGLVPVAAQAPNASPSPSSPSSQVLPRRLSAVVTFGALEGVSIFSPLGDAYGVAMEIPGGIRIVGSSTLAGLGTGSSDYPIVTLTVRVPATAAMGTVFPISLDPRALTLTGPDGQLYTASAAPGSLTVGDVPAVEDVIPGSGLVAANATVTVLGRGFSLDSRLRIEDAEIQQVRLVSPQEFEVTLNLDFQMHGARFRLRSGRVQTEYYAYQRTRHAFASRHEALQSVEPVPVFPGAASLVVPFPAATVGADEVQVMVVQNTHLENVTLQLSRVTLASGIESVLAITLPAASRLVLGLDEIFGSPCDEACEVSVEASSTVQAMGMVTDSALSRVQIIRSR